MVSTGSRPGPLYPRIIIALLSASTLSRAAGLDLFPGLDLDLDLDLDLSASTSSPAAGLDLFDLDPDFDLEPDL